MKLPPFLLDRWLADHEFTSPPIGCNLASSTGPTWRLNDLLALSGNGTDALAETMLSYAPPMGAPDLREAIGAFLNVDPEWVTVTTGASEALSILLCLAAEPGATIAAPAPGYPAVDVLARAWGMEVRRYALTRATRFLQDSTTVLAAVDDTTRLALVASPHNPTGSVMPRSEMEALAAALAERDVPLVADEVYHPLHFGAAAQSVADLPNAVAVGDMSKALSLPGLRIGWIVDRDAARRERIIDARSYFTISGSPLTERIATLALDARSALLDRLTRTADANLVTLETWIADQDQLDWERPAGGPIAFPWFRDGRDTRHFCERLAARGVLLAPGDCFEMPAHFRIGLGAQPELFREALAIMAQTLSEAPVC
ncbi:MAG: aminotransferase class I/II-fold pyridoxal phosphate-dependent enzyme [Novosphingobium sp.]